DLARPPPGRVQYRDDRAPEAGEPDDRRKHFEPAGERLRTMETRPQLPNERPGSHGQPVLEQEEHQTELIPTSQYRPSPNRPPTERTRCESKSTEVAGVQPRIGAELRIRRLVGQQPGMHPVRAIQEEKRGGLYQSPHLPLDMLGR